VKENLDTSLEAQRQFTREATVLANLSHPNLPRVTDHFIIPNQGQYLVMDFVEGEDLQTMLEKDGAIPQDRVLTWMRQVMDALEYLHRRTPPVLHRDIKPANIKITPEGKAILVDFGLVKLFDSHVKTTIGARAVTPGYSPPEQYGQGSTDTRTDIYALGATMYALLTGLQPPESVQRVAYDTLRPAHVVNPNVSARVGNAVTQAMALAPGNRFRAILQFRTALGGNTPEETSPQRSTEIPGRTYPAAYEQAKQVAPQPRKKKLPGWAIAVISLAGVSVLGGLCAILFLIPELKPTFATNTPVVAAKANTPMKSPSPLPENTPTTFITRTPVMRTSPTFNPSTPLALIAGPFEGEILHDSTDGLISVVNPEVSVADFIVQVDFIVPYSTSTGSWDIGFLFREQGFNLQYRLAILSDKTWYVTDHNGASAEKDIANGSLTNLNILEGDLNKIMLVAFQERGWFFLNEVLIAEFDLSSKTGPGNVELAVGLYAGNELDGKSTSYSNFNLWQTNLIPESGSLVHNQDTFIEEYASETKYTNFIVTSTFMNPYGTSTGTFDYGFMFRNLGGNDQFRLPIAESKGWELAFHTGETEGVMVNSGTVSNLAVGVGQSNNVTLVALEEKGWLLCNDSLVSELDLSSSLAEGTVSVASGLYTGNEIPGYSTDFSNFVVIPLP
jgi:serine/threonine protein kinase